MTRPSTLSIVLLFAGSLDLIFAFGLYFYLVWLKQTTAVPLPLGRPNRAIPLVLAAIGVFTILGGILTWGFHGG